jgi:hypothetical protein
VRQAHTGAEQQSVHGWSHPTTQMMKGIDMEAQEFDRLTRVHTTGTSRRGVVTGLGRGLVAALSLALIGSAGVADADAKRKHKKHKKHKKHHKAGVGSPTDPGTPTGPTSPDPSLPIGPGYCALEGPALLVSTGRVAQTFLPPQGGQLTKAAVFLQGNPADFALTFDIRPVDGAGVPTNTVLASHIVKDIPKTAFGGSPRLVTATFGTPATLALGQPYALSVTGPGTDQYWIHIRDLNPCADGQLFHDADANGGYVAVGGGAGDLTYNVTVV